MSPSLAADERTGAHDIAAALGVPVVEVRTAEGDDPAYRRNGADRCFHCKHELFTRIGDEVVAAHGLRAVAYGENADDTRRPDRPGARAATRHRVLRPLADAGMDKATVRRVARALGLANADKPAAPCLASRIPHGEPVTPDKLGAGRAGRGRPAPAGLRRRPGPAPRRRGPGRARCRTTSSGQWASRCAPKCGRRCWPPGSASSALDLAGIQSGAFTLPLVTRDG